MNLDKQNSSKKSPVLSDQELDQFLNDDFEFKPLTSGLGFHNEPKKIEVTKSPDPVMRNSLPKSTPRPTQAPISARGHQEIDPYASDLSLFYGKETLTAVQFPETVKEEVVLKKATASERVLSYFIDLSFLVALNSMIMVFVAWNVGMDLTELFFLYPDEMTPIAVTLFCGTYLIYFSVFEKTSSSTLGKSFLNLRVVTNTQANASWITLLMRSVFGLANFVSLGLFSYFDLANKVTNTKVVRAK